MIGKSTEKKHNKHETVYKDFPEQAKKPSSIIFHKPPPVSVKPVYKY